MGVCVDTHTYIYTYIYTFIVCVYMNVYTCMYECVCSILHMNIISVFTRAYNEHARTQTHTHMHPLINYDLFVCLHVRFMMWTEQTLLRRRLAGADNFSAWSQWARDDSQDGILF